MGVIAIFLGNVLDYNTEVNTIKYIAQENGYDTQLNKSLMQNEENYIHNVHTYSNLMDNS